MKKTTHFVSSDDLNFNSTEWLRNEWEKARAIAKSGEAIFVVDEIQKIKDWSPIVELLGDEDNLLHVPLKVVLTDSSSLLLQKGLVESLMGRFEKTLITDACDEAGVRVVFQLLKKGFAVVLYCPDAKFITTEAMSGVVLNVATNVVLNKIES